ncbi:AbrB/MazE/SpoVT family DNA-binding domain-containing protein [Sphingomonas sp. CLY1604]|uniref:AbrB/MazE/SpoVT family DNA-binding domain-containing protein n=1 Tax=Sphingomonas sp. CLY1604 TaxID=3457786 RepID=UPI003FD76356
MNKPADIKPAQELRVIKIGNSQGVILSKDLLAKLGVEQGGTIDVVAKPDGLFLRKHDAGFAEQMAVARDVMRRRRDALRELAK